MNSKTRQRDIAIMLLTIVVAVTVMSLFVSGDPTGAQLTNISTSTKTASNPDFGNHSKGAINTINLGATQQNSKWKAYVGNVTSSFVLDDADDYSIYQWDITSFTGEVYMTRNSTITWSNIDCATSPNKELEDTVIGHTVTSEDSVNSTFTSLAHKGFYVGSKQILQDNCFSIALNINDSAQTPSATQPFTEVLLWDSDGKMIYTTFVEQDLSGYRNDTEDTTFDFQAIVPAGIPGTPSYTYYFYLELATE